MIEAKGGTGAVAGQIAIWVLLAAIVVLLLAALAVLVRRRRRARWERDRTTSNQDDPFRRTGAAPVDASDGKDRPVSGAVQRFAVMPMPERPRWRPSRALLAGALALALILAAGGILWWRSGSGGNAKTDAKAAPAATSCPDAKLRVSASPDIAPVVEAAAEKLNGGKSCGQIAVTAEEPDVTEASSTKPDVWIPSSSAWLTIAGSDGARYSTSGAPLAYSPIVLAAPDAITKLFAKDGKTQWAALVSGVANHSIPAVTMPDPLHSTVGLLSVYAVHQAMNRTTPDGGIAQLRALTLRSRLKDASADVDSVLQQDATATDSTKAVYNVGIFPVTEQQLAAYGKSKPNVPLSAAVPVDGVVEADYPYAVAASTTHADLAARLKAAIDPAALTAAGFRTAAVPQAVKLPGAADGLLGPALQWSQYRTLKFQVLLVVDTSGSMNQKLTDKSGHQTTKAALLRQSGLTATQLFGEDTSVGMWYFSTPKPTSPAYTQVVALGPLTDLVGGHSRRDLLGAAVNNYKAIDGSGTPLYQTVLDGEAAMRQVARPDTVTLMVVLTDGRDEQSRYAMDYKTFMAKLAAGRDPSKPVPILAIGFGANADIQALSGMAQATGGKAVAASNPADLASAVAQAFLAAHAPS